MRKQDKSGKRYGNLVVVKEAYKDKRYGKTRIVWECICDCGNTCNILGERLSSGNTKSCGCLKPKKCGNYKHGKKYTRLYNIWQGMKGRCCNSNHTSYMYYGGKGIKIFGEWINDFQTFHDWAISAGYNDSLTIDRINSDGNYEPSNCRWVSMADQANNTSNNRLITANGKTQTLTKWSQETGINITTLSSRIKSLNWDAEKAMNTSAHANLGT